MYGNLFISIFMITASNKISRIPLFDSIENTYGIYRELIGKYDTRGPMGPWAWAHGPGPGAAAGPSGPVPGGGPGPRLWGPGPWAQVGPR